MVADFDLSLTQPDWALGFRWGHRPPLDAVRDVTGAHSLSDGLGPYFTMGSASALRTRSSREETSGPSAV